MSPGFYEFRLHNGGRLLARVVNSRTQRWRVAFSDPGTGAELGIRRRKGRGGMKSPLITVAGAARFGEFVALVPERVAGDL